MRISVAAMLSVVFVTLELVLWKLDLSAEFDDTFAGSACHRAPISHRRRTPAGDVRDAGGGTAAAADGPSAT